jgi:tRNA (guanine37-N1)-methyltransferase
MISVWCARVLRENGELVRQWLINHSLLERELKIQSENGWLIIPLTRELEDSEKDLAFKTFKFIQFEKRKMEARSLKSPKSLAAALKTKIPQELTGYIPKSFDIIGSLVIVEIPEEISSMDHLVGETLMTLQPSVTAVYKKLDAVKGKYRTRQLQLIAGYENSITIHKENKCRFELDIKKVYFSPRLATERNRIYNQVTQGEWVLDMFAGVGPFSIPIAKHRGAKVMAVDINPAAILYLNRNIKLNKVEDKVVAREGDVRSVILTESFNKFDRVIMNLPEKALEFMDIACSVIKAGGIIHFYQFVPDAKFPEKALEKLHDLVEHYDREIEEVLEIRKVRAYAPYIWHAGVDFSVK